MIKSKLNSPFRAANRRRGGAACGVRKSAIEQLEDRRLLAPLGVFADDDSDRLYVFDPVTAEITGSVAIPDDPSGNSPSFLKGDVEIKRDGSEAYLTDFRNNVWVIDLRTSPPTLAAGTNPIKISNQAEDIQLSADQRYLLVANGNGSPADGVRADPLSVIDTVARREVSTRVLGNSTPNAVVITLDNTVLSARYDASRIHKLQMSASGQLTGPEQTLAIAGPRNIVLHPNGRYAIVLSRSGSTNSLVSIDIESFQVVDSREMPDAVPLSGVFSLDGVRYFSRSSSSTGGLEGGRIEAIEFDPNTGTFGDSLFQHPVGSALAYFGIDQIDLSVDGTRLFVPNSVNDRIDVISTVDGSLLDTFTAAGVTAPTGIRVIDTNQRPVADAGGPYASAVGSSVQLDATASFDADDLYETLTIEWDLDGDGVFGESGAAATRGEEVGSRPTFLSRGIPAGTAAPVSLRVRDPRGLSAVSEGVVEVGYAADLTLRANDIFFSPAAPLPGEDVIVSARIRNAGLTVAESFDAKLLGFDTPLAGLTVDRLNAGQSTVIEFPAMKFDESFQLLTVQLDAAGRVRELEERNNEASAVLQVGDPVILGGDAAIELTVADAYGGFQSSAIVIGGNADYDFLQIEGKRDYPVQGGAVQVSILDPATLQPISIFTGSHTNREGAFQQPIFLPQASGTYVLRIEVSDGTLTSTAIAELGVAVQDIPDPIPTSPKPLTPPSGGTPSGGSPYVPSFSGGVVSDPFDLFVFSEDIVISRQPSEVGETIPVGAFIQFYGPQAVDDVQVELNSLFPVDGSLRSMTLASTLLDFPAASADTPVYAAITAPWTATQFGAHLIQARIIDDTGVTPAGDHVSTFTGNNQATRQVFVGVPPNDVSIDYQVSLLDDKDSNGISTPGDTLRYTTIVRNTSDSTLTLGSLTNRFDTGLLQSIAPVTAGAVVSDEQVNLAIGALPAGETATLIVDVQLHAMADFPAGFVQVHSDAVFTATETVPAIESTDLLVVGDIVAPDLQANLVLAVDPDVQAVPTSGGWYGQAVAMVLTADDPQPGSGIGTIDVSVDNQASDSTSGPQAVVELSDGGIHHVRAHVIDNAGNLTRLPDHEIKIDRTAPLFSGPDTIELYEDQELTLDLSWFSDGLSGLQSVRLVALTDEPRDAELPISIAELNGPATETARLLATDRAGNTLETVVTIKIRNRPPQVVISQATQQVSVGNAIGPVDITVQDVPLEPLDARAMIRLDDGPYQPLTSDTGLQLVQVSSPDSEGVSRWQLQGVADLSPGHYTIRVDVTDDESTTSVATALQVTGTFEIVGFTVNDGQTQRSNVSQVAVAFNQPTQLQQRIDDGTIVDMVRIVGTQNDLSQRTLTAQHFQYDPASNTLTIDLTTDGIGGSERTLLSDDRYQIQIQTPSVLSAHDLVLLDNDGLLDEIWRSDFHRLAGDFSGDQRVDINDRNAWFDRAIVQFNATRGTAGYNIAFDTDDDGRITTRDYYFWLRGFVGNQL